MLDSGGLAFIWAFMWKGSLSVHDRQIHPANTTVAVTALHPFSNWCQTTWI